MKNPFEALETPLKEVPTELRAKVMKDVAFAKLLMGIMSLFSLNLSDIIEKTISNRNTK